MFGDQGNDWIVGGTGDDHLYGGFGDDLLNADDDQTTAGGRNNQPNATPSYEDLAYGGAGRDVLIANTAGDRLIDWAGEFNSYLVPFAPFGAPTITRTSNPAIDSFLYSAVEVRRRRLDARRGDASRNGEPNGELGLVTQQDPAWGDQTGAPRDPQPGNTSGVARDVMAHQTFTTTATNFSSTAGGWSVNTGAGQDTSNGQAVSLYSPDVTQPDYVEIASTVNVPKSSGGTTSGSGFLVFDYQSNSNFKFAGIDVSQSVLQIGHATANGWVIDAQLSLGGSAKLSAGNDYQVLAALNGTTATVTVNGKSLAYKFGDSLNDGALGLAAGNSNATFSSFQVQAPPPVTTFTDTVQYNNKTTSNPYSPQAGTWAIGSNSLVATSDSSSAAIATRTVPVAANTDLNLRADVNPSGTGATAGLVFDYVSASNYKFAAYVGGTNVVVIGHVTAAGTTIDASVSSGSMAIAR